MSRNLIEETLCDVFTTGYCSATDGINNSFLLFVECVVTEIVYNALLDKTRNKNLNGWS